MVIGESGVSCIIFYSLLIYSKTNIKKGYIFIPADTLNFWVYSPKIVHQKTIWYPVDGVVNEPLSLDTTYPTHEVSCIRTWGKMYHLSFKCIKSQNI